MNEQHKLLVGQQIKELATLLAQVAEDKWSSLVFTVACRKSEETVRLTDRLFIRLDGDDEYTDAYGEDMRGKLDQRLLMQVGRQCRKLREVCKQLGDDWQQYTICIERDGAFESFFSYPGNRAVEDPFDKARFDEWKRRFLYDE